MPGQGGVKVQILTVLNEIQNAGFNVLLQGLFQELQVRAAHSPSLPWLSFPLPLYPMEVWEEAD